MNRSAFSEERTIVNMHGKTNRHCMRVIQAASVFGAIAITAICCVACFADSDSTHSSFLPPTRYRNVPLYSFTLDSANYTNENDRIIYHLLRFDSEELDSDYEVIGSVAPSYPPNFCSEDALLCVELDSTCDHFIVVPLTEPEVHDTVLSLCFSPDYWFPSRRHFEFRRLDSTLVFAEGSPKPSVKLRSLICRVKPGRTCDTVAIIENTRLPDISDDGTEVFLFSETDFPNADSTAMDSSHFSVSIYDLVDDSLILPFPADWQVVNVSRPNRESPLFYVRVDSSHMGSNVWMVRDSTHIQLTRLMPDEYAGYFMIKGDSLICNAYKGWPRQYRRVAVGLD